MYDVLVCFKVTEDFDALSLSEWQGIQGRPYQAEQARRVLGCFDEAALEQGILHWESYRKAGREAALSALTLQPGYSEPIIRRLFAVGYEQIFLIEDTNRDLWPLHFTPKLTAEILSSSIRELEQQRGKPFDMILCGQQASPGNSGLVPGLLEAMLGRTVHTSSDEGGVYLRVPTLRDKLNTKNRKPVVLELPEGLAERIGCSRFPKLMVRHVPRRCQMFSEDDMEMLAGHILKEGGHGR